MNVYLRDNETGLLRLVGWCDMDTDNDRFMVMDAASRKALAYQGALLPPEWPSDCAYHVYETRSIGERRTGQIERSVVLFPGQDPSHLPGWWPKAE